MFCQNCGANVDEKAAVCIKCGVAIVPTAPPTTQTASSNAKPIDPKYQNISDKDWTVTLILSIFLGGFGVDRFYAGQIVMGLLKLILPLTITIVTCGVGSIAYVWWLIDIILIVTDNFKDGQGRVITNKKV
ncbi:MAG: TM2 domain-containing protein [Fibromonadales bacterium]|nr:TM2 domain-containing protein [Fibromonadales bacterium]